MFLSAFYVFVDLYLGTDQVVYQAVDLYLHTYLEKLCINLYLDTYLLAVYQAHLNMNLTYASPHMYVGVC